MCYPPLSSAFVSVMHFSRPCIVARICVTFNYPTIVLALLMQLFNNKQSALFFTLFCTFPFSFRRPFCIVIAFSDRTMCQ